MIIIGVRMCQSGIAKAPVDDTMDELWADHMESLEAS
jgi:hypothetical protein